MKNLIVFTMLLAACGGSQKSGLGKGKDVPPPPPVAKNDAPPEPGKAEPKRELSKDAKADYKAALEYFTTNEKGGWNDSACRSAADKFASVVRDHAELVEAEFMAGLSYQRCNLLEDAEKAYQAASHMKGDVAKSVSSLGTLYYKAGKIDGAKQYWEAALKASGKLVGAHVGLATILLEQMRKINNPKDAGWKKLEEDARLHLSSALGVDSENVEAYTDYGLVYMEGWRSNPNRLDLAKTLLDEAKKRNEKYAPLQNAYGLYWMHKGALNQALAAFQAAVELDPKFVEARINAGLLTVNFRKYDTAKELLSKAVELAPKNYEAMNALGIAMRGLNDLDGAEQAYKKAQQINPQLGKAYYNLAVLYKDFKASHSTDLAASITTYKTARDYFQQFLDKDAEATDKTEAKEQIALIDKTTKQIQQFMAAQAANPPPPTAPAPAPAPAGTPPATPAPAPKK